MAAALPQPVPYNPGPCWAKEGQMATNSTTSSGLRPAQPRSGCDANHMMVDPFNV
jgi:hypothetical protein